MDFIASTGGKLLLTAAAEEAAGVGHDVLSYYGNWEVALHRKRLEPVDDLVNALIQKYGKLNPMIEYLAKHEGHWFALPATAMSALFPACSRLDFYKQYAGLDLKEMFPPHDKRDQGLVDSWNWDLYLATAARLYKAGYPIGLPMGQTLDTLYWVSAALRSFGAILIDAKDNIRINSDATRAALEFMKKIMPFNPPDVYAWDDAGNNRWLISGKGSSILNPPSAWAVAVRDNPRVAEQCWSHDVPRGPQGRYTPHNAQFYGIWNFSANKPAALTIPLISDQPVNISEKPLLENKLGELLHKQPRVCPQLRRMIAETSWTPARKFLASLS